MKIYLCEKPSQAGDIARELGQHRRHETHWDADGGRVTWCVGHMLSHAMPEDYDAGRYGPPWRWDVLPILPRPFRYYPNARTAGQLRAIGHLLKEASSVVVATDADREGEMIGREVLDHFQFRGPVERLWLSSLDPESIRRALGKLRPGVQTERLYFAAKARSEADWLIGMNLSRAISLKSPRGGGVVSVGRVQSPTLALVVRRDREIAAFVPRQYYELTAVVKAGGETVLLHHAPKVDARIYERAKAEAEALASIGQQGPLGVVEEAKRTPPKRPFSLSSLQKRADVLWGWTAKKTLGVAQSLYEKHKATTYPRTDCEFLPDEQAADVGIISEHLVRLKEFTHLVGLPLSRQATVFSTKKVTAHHAIIPTRQPAALRAMDDDERKAYLLIAAHYLASLLPDYEYLATTLKLRIGNVEFSATGQVPIKSGWKAVFQGGESETEGDEAPPPPLPPLKNGTPAQVEACSVETKKTKPPERYTEGTLIADMENAGKYVEDAEKRRRLNSEEGKQRGIGTEATRADIIAGLRSESRGFIEAVKGRQLRATEKGRGLIALLESALPAIADPGETAVWEEQLEAIAAGEIRADKFVEAIGSRVGEYLCTLGQRPGPPPVIGGGSPTGVRVPSPVRGQAEVELVLHKEGHYTAEGWPGRFFGEINGLKMTPQHYLALIVAWAEGKPGPRFTGFTSRRTGAAFAARLTFHGDMKPYPKVTSEILPA